jgi:hypothetical protein
MTKFLFEQGDRRRRGAADADDLMHMAGCPQADRRPGTDVIREAAADWG